MIVKEIQEQCTETVSSRGMKGEWNIDEEDWLEWDKVDGEWVGGMEWESIRLRMIITWEESCC